MGNEEAIRKLHELSREQAFGRPAPPLLAKPGELAVGRAESLGEAPWVASLDGLKAVQEVALGVSPEFLQAALGVMDLLADPEPPDGLIERLSDEGFGGMAAWHAWAWLRRQAGLEG